jgi:TorA maturation chaperone TorD
MRRAEALRKSEFLGGQVAMRDLGLQRAIDAAGGISELARKVGISQPSVSNWSRIPADRVVAVAEATGIDRAVLRPDLFGERYSMPNEIDEIDSARAQEYALLAALLSRAPDRAFLQRLGRLRGDATLLGIAHVQLAQAASNTDHARVEREFFDLFIGIGRGELLPYGSYYLTGFLHERPLARLRDDLIRLGVERGEGIAEPEDHAAILCEIMSGMISGQFAAPPDSDRSFFEKHLAPWIGRFFADLERAPGAEFYRNVGALGSLFTHLEMEAFGLAGEAA